MPDSILFPPEQLFEFTTRVFRHLGVPEGDARTAATVLQLADLRGIDSHGVARLHTASPGLEEPPIVLDMATSATAYGKIEIAKRAGKPIPLGWAIDRDGAPTTDPNAMIDGGAQLPLGSDRERGGHKGYGLALMVDVLSAVLSGANWGPFVPPFALRQGIPDRLGGQGIGLFFGAFWVVPFIRTPVVNRQLL